ncbi:hypothetical protein FDUTEX481_04691 [Tolypothrix sp. PCC 7601]|nr:hypothetical protein FDUTEX481_04691 [Tolypothrix sp. PCC 7601]
MILSSSSPSSPNTCRLRAKGEGEKGQEKPLTLTLSPFPQTKLRVENP